MAAATALVGGLIAASLLPIASAAAAESSSPIAGGQTSGDSLFPNQGNSGYDALHYDIDMRVNVAVSTTNNAVSKTTFPDATATISAVTTGAPLSSYSFDFQGSTSTLDKSTLNVDAVTVNGVPATFSRIENTTTGDTTTDKHKLIVTPATPVDGDFTTVVKYSGTPVAHTDADDSSEGWNATTDGATFVNQPVGSMTAYPNNNTPSDKATYTMTVNAPSKLTTSATAVASNPGLKDAAVVSNGELVSTTPSEDGSRTTWVWNEKKQMASELALISVGRYDMYHSNITLASGRVLPEWTFIDPAISKANQLTTLATRVQLKSMLDFFETKYGPYPGNSIGLLTDVVPSAINYALETQDRPFFPSSASRSTATHEIMHQWFGDNESPADWNDIWLNEGPATYSETQLPFESSGTSTAPTESSVYTSWNNTASTSSLWKVPVAGMTDAEDLFGSPTYTRGNMTLVALRTAIGSANFETLMRQWQVRYGGTSHHTADFIDLAEKISGKDLTDFFTTWIYTTGKPAWPAKWDLTLAGPAAPVAPGDAVEYTLSSRNTGKVAQAGSVVTVDISDVLDDGVLGDLPDGVTRSGATLTWDVPSTAIGATSTVAIPVTIAEGTNGDAIAATASTPATTLGATCFNCSATVVIGAAATSPSAVPTITGSPVFGQTLTANTGQWASGASFTYQWLVDGTPVTGATSSTFTPDVYSVGSGVSVQVTGTKGSASPTRTTSAATAAVTRAPLTSIAPTIVGTAQMGKPLTVVVPTYDAGTYFTYQWYTATGSGTPVAVSAANGGTGPTFTPAVATMVGQTVTVAVTPTKAGYTAVTPIAQSAPTAAIATGVFDDAPTAGFVGSPRALTTFTAAPGQWDDGTTLSYQWTLDGVAIDGATAITYTPTIAQIGSKLTVSVTGIKPGFPTTTRTSDPSPAIAPAAQTLTPTPIISGTAKVNSELTATPGTWDADTALSYQWLVDGTPIDGATGTTYTLAPKTVHGAISVAVTSTKTNYEPATTTSDPTAAVAPDDLVTASVPTISGATKVGVKLTASPGTWDDGTAFSYQWFANGVAVPGAIAATYTPDSSMHGATLSVAVTGSKLGFVSQTTSSAPTSTIASGDLALVSTPTITGTAKVGSRLTAIPGQWDAGTVLAYQWLRDGKPIAGAVAPTYTVAAADYKHSVSVAVTGTLEGYAPITTISVAKKPAAGTQARHPKAAISGKVRLGHKLKVKKATFDSGVTLSYSWYANGRKIKDSKNTLTLTNRYKGMKIKVTVKSAKTGYVTLSSTSKKTARVK